MAQEPDYGLNELWGSGTGGQGRVGSFEDPPIDPTSDRLPLAPHGHGHDLDVAATGSPQGGGVVAGSLYGRSDDEHVPGEMIPGAFGYSPSSPVRAPIPLIMSPKRTARAAVAAATGSPLHPPLPLRPPSPPAPRPAPAPAPAPAPKRARKSELPLVPPPSKKGRSRGAGKGKADKGSRGLRHFSLKVCQKVEQKGTTTYNEVADELVADIKAAANGEPITADQNIRRRVYDALNVLMAMDIISKNKKDISWRGLPKSTKKETEKLKREVTVRLDHIKQKRLHLEELLQQHIAVARLIHRNKNFDTQPTADRRVRLPFIIINAPKDTRIELQIGEDHKSMFYDFNQPFKLHDENEVLAEMQMHHVPTRDDIPESVPEELRDFVPKRFVEDEDEDEEEEGEDSDGDGAEE